MFPIAHDLLNNAGFLKVPTPTNNKGSGYFSRFSVYVFPRSFRPSFDWDSQDFGKTDMSPRERRRIAGYANGYVTFPGAYKMLEEFVNR